MLHVATVDNAKNDACLHLLSPNMSKDAISIQATTHALSLPHAIEQSNFEILG